MKVSDLISRTVLRPVRKAKNLDTLGWCDGYLLVRFKGRDTLYIYGPNIAEAERDKILANPYPDALFTRLREKHKWQCHKVEAAA
jgi:hypothetical protein